MSCYVDTTCRCVGQGMGNTASVADHIQTFIAALKIIVNLNFHIVEFNLHTIQQSIVIGSSRSYVARHIAEQN